MRDCLAAEPHRPRLCRVPHRKAAENFPGTLDSSKVIRHQLSVVIKLRTSAANGLPAYEYRAIRSGHEKIHLSPVRFSLIRIHDFVRWLTYGFGDDAIQYNTVPPFVDLVD